MRCRINLKVLCMGGHNAISKRPFRASPTRPPHLFSWSVCFVFMSTVKTDPAEKELTELLIQVKEGLKLWLAPFITTVTFQTINRRTIQLVQVLDTHISLFSFFFSVPFAFWLRIQQNSFLKVQKTVLYESIPQVSTYFDMVRYIFQREGIKGFLYVSLRPCNFFFLVI